MTSELSVSVGQHSDKGRKPLNQDFHGLCIPRQPLLGAKGIAVALADGISSSDAGHVASASAVQSFLDDYYCTSDAWSVKTSAHRVIEAANAWLYAQTFQGQGRFDKDRGHVCTFSALVLRSTTAHLFHVGDARIYRVHAQSLEQLTNDHRVHVSREENFLSRALGIASSVDIDYQAQPLAVGDTFLLATDGVHQHVGADVLAATIQANAADLDHAARTIIDEALHNGSPDNLTVQIVRVDALPDPNRHELPLQAGDLPLPPPLSARAELDGFRIERELHGSSRSHVYLATDLANGNELVIKTPSVDLQDDKAYRERFLMEEWVARRIHNDHVMRAYPSCRQRTCLYTALAYVPGQTLAQWMRDHPTPDLAQVRDIVEQVAKGLRAFHRMEMLHQDLRPENIMIDPQGTVCLIDFGSVAVASLAETAPPDAASAIPGTLQYTAPEYFLGQGGSARADTFALASITYQMLTGRLPYGLGLTRVRQGQDLKRLSYEPIRLRQPHIPVWVDKAIEKAVSLDPHRRHDEVSEFAWDLRHPNRAYLRDREPPLVERHPVAFWQGVSFVLLLLLLAVLATHHAPH
ncbi:MAG: bifunctional protein-serine/threonine kinase/phosphatase [Hydrogenophaga sp.]|uniref:bifunctional protein-serine/threonine kinase/phosphatase n=1 Tax=Hydrogenophaga sp. TaxID=1904254 RepID=UPI001D55C6E2|nr:bifunctional protein-serine/threonine kinase/phosphatase [Hydrogenophaga sp.]MBX3611046.1 bifunctional protein-serine/threonine kinase/phosphatase [Hydrogenophaga sp.]